MKDLPSFKHRDYDAVRAYAAQMLTNHTDPQTTLLRLTEREDHSFEAVFAARYFVLAEGATEPTKSQWNNLKKRFKRSDSSLFIFKEHGACPCTDGKPGCYYLRFGYYAKRETPPTSKAPPRRSGAYRARPESGGDAPRPWKRRTD
jgi:hypothetical protein